MGKVGGGGGGVEGDSPGTNFKNKVYKKIKSSFEDKT